MTAQRWGEVKAVLAGVLESDPRERTPALERLCGGDADLRREVESLLALEERADALLESAAVPGTVLRAAPAFHQRPSGPIGCCAKSAAAAWVWCICASAPTASIASRWPSS